MTKIAFPSEDGSNISQHFGRAPFFVVASLDEQGQVKWEQRSKAFHGAEHTHQHGPEGHSPMFAPIADCQVLVAGGMGQPAYQHAQQASLEVILTGEKSISAALQSYQSGALASDMRRIHMHGQAG